MGCCASKSAEGLLPSIEEAGKATQASVGDAQAAAGDAIKAVGDAAPSKEAVGTTIAATGTVGGAALVGAALAGPAAPIGALVGAAVGAIIARSTAGTVGKVVVAPVGLLEDLWRGLVLRPEILEKLPDLGMLRSERAVYPPTMPDLTETNKYLYQIHPATVKGLTYEDALAGVDLSAAQQEALEAAVKELEQQGVLAITGDCSAMLKYQPAVQKLTSLPVCLSSLLQAPLLAAVFSAQEQVLVLTSDASSTPPESISQQLRAVGVSEEDIPRFIVVGCETIPGFKTADLVQLSSVGDLDLKATSEQLLKIIQTSVAKAPAVRAVLMESTMLPMFSDLIRRECRLPVFDSVSLADLVHKGSTDNPRFGVSFGPSAAPELRFDASQMPGIGIMRIDYT